MNPRTRSTNRLVGIGIGLLTISCAPGDMPGGDNARYLAEHYNKHEYRIPLRDGAALFTAVYVPNDTSQSYPFLMKRTPYSVGPYGEDQFPSELGPAGSNRIKHSNWANLVSLESLLPAAPRARLPFTGRG